jgi:glycosyltransferase involved in cell wall biosynthesis
LNRLAIITTQAFSLSNFRGPLIQDLVSRGVNVFAFASDYTNITRDAVAALGAVPVDFKMSRTGMNPVLDFVNCLQLATQLRKLQLDTVLTYFIKPVIYGSIAAFFSRVPNRFAMIEGAGYVFTEGSEKSLFRSILRFFVSLLYKISLSRVKRVFVLNSDDKNLFLDKGMVGADKLQLINGIGVRLDYYHFSLPVIYPVCFILIARLLREKGIYDYVDAARIVKKTYPNTRFLLLGNIDSNPGSIQVSEAEVWVKEGIIEWPGQVSDVRDFLSQSSVFVLPSYREGLPRSTQEAMAMGRAVITTDVPGCRETVLQGFNGFLVPAREPNALADAMFEFIEQPDLIKSMGVNSRKIAEMNFNVHEINKIIIDLMQDH